MIKVIDHVTGKQWQEPDNIEILIDADGYVLYLHDYYYGKQSNIETVCLLGMGEANIFHKSRPITKKPFQGRKR